MFLRRSGRRILLLHSYRDGRDQVCQLRLGHLLEEEAAERFESPDWRAEIEAGLPGVRIKWSHLRERLVELLASGGERVRRARQREDLVEERLKALLRALAGETDAKVLDRVAAALQARARCQAASWKRAEECLEEGDLKAAEQELRDLVVGSRAPLDSRRKRFAEKEPEVKSYLLAQARLGQLLLQQGRWPECAEVERQRAACCPTREACLDLGAALQRQGKLEAAAIQYSRLPRHSAWRHYNLASAALQAERYEEGLRHLLRGFGRGRGEVFALRHLEAGRTPGSGHEYWDRYGHLWGERARRFFLVARAEPLVGYKISSADEWGKLPRDLVKGWAFDRLLERVLKKFAETA